MSSTLSGIFTHLFPTGFGEIAIVWYFDNDGTRIRRIFLSSRSNLAGLVASRSFPQAAGSSNREIIELENDIRRMLEGEAVQFDLSMPDLSVCTSFQRSILLSEARIPRGEVWSYSALARYSGAPGCARAAGRALSSNPFPLLIPCHRTVRSDGSPGGYQGGTAMKLALLRMEGAIFISSGRLLVSCSDE